LNFLRRRADYRIDIGITSLGLSVVVIFSPLKLVLVTWLAIIINLSPLFATCNRFLIATLSPVILTVSRGTSFLINLTSPPVTSKFASFAIVRAKVGSGTALTLSCAGPGAG